MKTWPYFEILYQADLHPSSIDSTSFGGALSQRGAFEFDENRPVSKKKTEQQLEDRKVASLETMADATNNNVPSTLNGTMLPSEITLIISNDSAPERKPACSQIQVNEKTNLYDAIWTNEHFMGAGMKRFPTDVATNIQNGQQLLYLHICEADGSKPISYIVGKKGVSLKERTTKELYQAAPKNTRGLVQGGHIRLSLEAIEMNAEEEEQEIE